MKLLYPLLTLGGALIGVLVGIATRPSVLGVPIPLEALTSSVRADLPLKDELTNHLLLTGGIGLMAGLVVALAVGIVAASLRGGRPLPNSPASVPVSAATYADPNVLKALDWKLGICTAVAVNVVTLASGFFFFVSVLPYLILGGVGFPLRFFVYLTGEVYAGGWLGVVLAQILIVLVFSALPAVRAALTRHGNLRGAANLAATSVLAALITVTAWDILIGFSADLNGLFQEYGGLDTSQGPEGAMADFAVKVRLRYWCAILSTASVVAAVQWLFLRRKQRRLAHPA